MTRVLSALALLPVVVGTIWYLPSVWTLVLAAGVLALAVHEYADLAGRVGAPVPRLATVLLALLVCVVAFWWTSHVGVVLMLAAVGLAAMTLGTPEGSLAGVAAAVFALIYLALPLGSLAALHLQVGREAVLLLLVTVMVSDTAQYYGGRTLGRRPLAPRLSPKKTVEGAVSGVVAASVALWLVGEWWLPTLGPVARLALGASLSLSGIAGDLFESSLKRAAQVKDASTLIPGHGGILDRLDGILFSAPVFLAVVTLHG